MSQDRSRTLTDVEGSDGHVHGSVGVHPYEGDAGVRYLGETDGIHHTGDAYSPLFGVLFITLFALYAKNDLLILASVVVLFFGLFGTGDLLSKYPAGKIIDKIGFRPMIILAYILISISYFLMSETESILFFLLIFLVYGIGHGIRVVSEITAIGASASKEVTCTAMAYISTVPQLGVALGAFIAGILSVVLATPLILKIASTIIATNVIAAIFLKKGSKLSSIKNNEKSKIEKS